MAIAVIGILSSSSSVVVRLADRKRKYDLINEILDLVSTVAFLIMFIQMKG